MDNPIDWSSYLKVIAVLGLFVLLYLLRQIRESTVLSWILGLVIMGVLCASMFGTAWLK